MPGDRGCANRAAGCGAPAAANRKFSDLAIGWLMLTAELEDQVFWHPGVGPRFEKGA